MKLLPIVIALIATPALALDVKVGGAKVSASTSGVSASTSKSSGGQSVSASANVSTTNSTVSGTALITSGANGAIANVNTHAAGGFGSGVKVNIDGTISLTTNTVIWGSGGKALGRAAGKCTGGIAVVPFGNDEIVKRRACIKTSNARVRNGELVVDLSRATFLKAFK